MNVVFVDGSVKFVRLTLDMNVWMAYATIAGGEVLPDL